MMRMGITRRGRNRSVFDLREPRMISSNTVWIEIPTDGEPYIHGPKLPTSVHTRQIAVLPHNWLFARFHLPPKGEGGE